MQRKNYLFVCVSLVLLVTVGIFIAHQISPERGISFAQGEIGKVNRDPDAKLEGFSLDNANTVSIPVLIDNPYRMADIAEAANPATVYIHVKWPAKEDISSIWDSDPLSFFFDFWSRQPFQRAPVERVTQGSGFIIHQSGIVLTNQHVVGNAGDGQTITVTVSAPEISGEFTAEILGSDERLDLAVLKLEGEKPFPAVALGDSDKSRPGEWVIAIGNPYGKRLDHTVTVGVLSAKGREIEILSSGGTLRVYKNLMQIDAAINSGNSGGPLFNIEGEVIGINTAVHAEAQGIGFAIPINVVKEVLQELIETGEVQPRPEPWLGIYLNDIDENLMEKMRLADTKGIFVTDVVLGSPADEAGIKANDIIRRFNGIDLYSSEELTEAVSNYEPGDEVVLTILRDGNTKLVTLIIGDKPAHLRD